MIADPPVSLFKFGEPEDDMTSKMRKEDGYQNEALNKSVTKTRNEKGTLKGQDKMSRSCSRAHPRSADDSP